MFKALEYLNRFWIVSLLGPLTLGALRAGLFSKKLISWR
jgi:hypothetical protein